MRLSFDETVGHRRSKRPSLISISLAALGILLGLASGSLTAHAQAPAAPDSGPEFISPVPNVEWGDLDEAGRERATRIMNEHMCPCGCGMNLAQCRRDDLSCSHSPRIASQIIAALGEGDADAQVVASLSLAPVAARAAPAPVAGAASAVQRTSIPIAAEDPSIGPEDAPVTLVEFIDYQCPFCARAHDTVARILEKYEGRLKLVLKQNPLSFHPDAPLAAQAALAAFEQGRFRPMHDAMMGNTSALKRDDLMGYASRAGLDMGAFEKVLDSSAFAAKIQSDMDLAARVGATGTPYFFINGRPLRGAQPLSAFERLIEEELNGGPAPTAVSAAGPGGGNDAAPRAPVAAGDPVMQKLEELHREVRILRGEMTQLRRTLAENAGGAAAAPAPRAGDVAPRAAATKVELDEDDPVMGSSEAGVAIVEFSDYQCPFCRRYSEQTFPELKKNYIDTGKIQYVFRDYPLRIHPQAKPAAVAANCAGLQGAYWEMHDALFREQQRLGADLYRELAERFELDAEAFSSCTEDASQASEVEKDGVYGLSIGVRGTPSFFVGRLENGELVDIRALSGAQPFSAFAEAIESLLN